VHFGRNQDSRWCGRRQILSKNESQSWKESLDFMTSCDYRDLAPGRASMKSQLLFYIIHLICLISLKMLLGLFHPLSFSCRHIAPISRDSVLVLKMQQDSATPHIQIARALRLATYTGSGGEEPHSKGGGGGTTSCWFQEDAARPFYLKSGSCSDRIADSPGAPNRRDVGSATLRPAGGLTLNTLKGTGDPHNQQTVPQIQTNNAANPAVSAKAAPPLAKRDRANVADLCLGHESRAKWAPAVALVSIGDRSHIWFRQSKYFN
jgi:hypothetical protein